MTLQEQIERAERYAVHEALTATAGNVRQAAVELAIHERTLWRMITRLEIDRRDYCASGNDAPAHNYDTFVMV